MLAKILKAICPNRINTKRITTEPSITTDGTSLASATLPAAISSRDFSLVERQISSLPRASFEILSPTEEDLWKIRRLSDGSLLSLWAGIELSDKHKVNVFFNAARSEKQGHYILLRTKTAGIDALFKVVDLLKEKFGGKSDDRPMVSGDELAMVINLDKISGGFMGFSGDRVLLARYLELASSSRSPGSQFSIIPDRVYLQNISGANFVAVGLAENVRFDASFFLFDPRVTVRHEVDLPALVA